MTKDELLAYLDSPANEFGLESVPTHGFLVATVVGKDLPNWLSVYFEGQENQISQDIKTALIAWQQELANTLKNEAPLELPFDGDDEALDLSDESDIVAWCIGFVDAMYGNDDCNWFDDESTEEDVADLTLPMIVISGIDDEDEEQIAIRQDEAIMATLINSIEDNLTELYLLFHTEE